MVRSDELEFELEDEMEYELEYEDEADLFDPAPPPRGAALLTRFGPGSPATSCRAATSAPSSAA